MIRFVKYFITMLFNYVTSLKEVGLVRLVKTLIVISKIAFYIV